MFDNELRLFGTHVGEFYVAIAAHPAGVEHVALVAFFVTTHADLIGIDHHDEVAGVGMRCVNGFVAATKHIGNLDGDATQSLVSSVHNIPFFGVAGFSS